MNYSLHYRVIWQGDILQWKIDHSNINMRTTLIVNLKTGYIKNFTT